MATDAGMAQVFSALVGFFMLAPALVEMDPGRKRTLLMALGAFFMAPGLFRLLTLAWMG